MGHSWYRIIPGIIKNPENILTPSCILFLFLGMVGFALAVWLIGLGVGLLVMKGWARRGSIIYAWIQIVFMIITLGATFISLIIDLIGGWQDFLRVFWGTMNIGNGIVAIQWIYMILLLIFMKTEKIKRAFSAVGG